MNGFFSHLCSHIGYTGSDKPPVDGQMIEMTLPSRHRIRDESTDDLMPSTLPSGPGSSPNTEYLRVSGEETFRFFET